MAEQKTTNTKGRKPKAQTEVKVEEKASQEDIIKQLMEQIAEQKKAMEELQKQISNSKNNSDSQEINFSGKKIKCINLMHNPINISTEPDGQGRCYSFKNYGESRMIKFDELSDIVASYPYTMEHGFVYICDPRVVEIFGLDEDYKNVYTKEVLDKIIWLKEDSDLDLFLGLEDNLKESMAVEIAKLMNNNERMNYNYLREIKEKCGIDIEDIAKSIKEDNATANQVE